MIGYSHFLAISHFGNWGVIIPPRGNNPLLVVLFPQGNFWQLIINFRRLIISQSNYWKVIILPSFYLLSENEVNISRPRSEIFFVMTERTRLISYLLYSLFIMDLSLQSIKTNTWPWLANNFKKTSPQWAVHLRALDTVRWYWSADTLFDSCQLTITFSIIPILILILNLTLILLILIFILITVPFGAPIEENINKLMANTKIDQIFLLGLSHLIKEL